LKVEQPHKEYHTSAHLVYSCQYHVIFCPKYRRKILTNEIYNRLVEIFVEVAEKHQFKIIEQEIMPDHVHLLIDVNPRFGIMQALTKLKAVSSRTLRKEFPSLKTRLPSLWTRSAFISSVGAVTLEVVKRYIEQQKGK
jgi:putative transposase